MKHATPRPGRTLGFTDADRRSPFAHHLREEVAPPAPHVERALVRGPRPEPLLPPLAAAMQALPTGAKVLEDGFTLTTEGELRLAVRTELPGVTPAMIDWWFGWHSDSPERYKLWHPEAHVHAEWLDPPARGTTGRARYLGRTSIVDEYVGSSLGRYAIRFVPHAELGLASAALDDGRETAICARAGLADLPVDAGWLVHHVRPVPGGSEMRSRFFVGGPHVAGRAGIGPLLTPLARRVARPTEGEARALLVHCAEEMAHLATFLPALFREAG